MKRTAALLFLFASPLAAQSPLDSAATALARGQGWRATQLLAPLLNASATRTPDVVILAARAAASWEGWATVRKLLEGQPWLDERFDGLGHRLLAEADLGDNRNPQALAQALAAVIRTSTPRSASDQGMRLILLARAYDRLDQLDSAAAVYLRAGAQLPDLADWLTLRAAGVTSDSIRRAALLGTITLAAAIPRVPWTDALARDRSGDPTGAALRYEHLAARAKALDARWRAASTDADRRAVTADLAAVFRAPVTTAEARDALELAARIAPPFTRDEQLELARRAAAVARPQDAVNAFAIAAKMAPLMPRDRFSYAAELGNLKRWDDAAEQFRAVRDPALAGHAAYYAARAMLRAGNDSRAITALGRVVRSFPKDTVAAGLALYLLGDLAIDAGHPDSARARFRTLVRRYPSSSLRPHAELLAALIAFARGDAATAERELSAALAAHQGSEVDASRYWLARSRLVLGDTTAARSLLRELVARGPESYYAVRAAARLDTLPWRDTTTSRPLATGSLPAAFTRAAALDSLGLDVEAQFEREHLAAQAKDAEALRTAAAQFATAELPSRAAQLASRALAAGAPRDGAIWRMIYPLPYESVLREAAEHEQVDPLLAAAVIRQESAFDPHATSRTDARGLLQVEPRTGAAGARALGISDFDAALLWVADVNLAIGMRHFAAALARYPETERALAAYNAGTTPVDRWSQSLLGGDKGDMELFVERIPFVETRNYVRAIERNLTVYRMLYQR